MRPADEPLMTIRFDRPVSHAARASRLVAAFALVLCVVVLVGHRFGPLETPYFVLFLLISAIIAAVSGMTLRSSTVNRPARRPSSMSWAS